MHVSRLLWGGGCLTHEAQSHSAEQPGDSDAPNAVEWAAAHAGAFDLVLGCDICYEESSVPHVLALLEKLGAPLAYIIGPAGRPSVQRLREQLAASPHVVVEERRLTLVCANADVEPAPDEERRSAGVHSLLVVTPATTKAQ